MPTKANAKAKVSKTGAKSTPPWPLITVGAAATIVLLALMAMTWLVIAHQSDRMGDISRIKFDDNRGSFLHSRPRGMHMGRPVASGVITAINSDALTISGGGQQVTVNRTASTTVRGDKDDAAINDTVVVFGTKGDDGTITASRILVRNQLLDKAPALNRSPDVFMQR